MSATIQSIHHLGLTVRDAEVSAHWYEKALAFRRVGTFEDAAAARRKIFLRHDGLRSRLGLTQHRETDGEPFMETAVGLDHLSFGVSSLEDLRSWATHLAGLGIHESPIAPANSIPDAYVLVFRDPDNIQLELFFDPTDDHRADAGLATSGAITYLHIPATDVRQSAVFYREAFGWHIHNPDSDRPSFDDTSGRLSGAWISDRLVANEPGLLPYIYVDHVDETVARIVAHGGQIVTHPFPEGLLTVATFRDPAGNVVGLWHDPTR